MMGRYFPIVEQNQKMNDAVLSGNDDGEICGSEISD
jgi:hypothetical protein